MGSGPPRTRGEERQRRGAHKVPARPFGRGGRGERKSGPGVPRDGVPSGSAPSCAPGSPAQPRASLRDATGGALLPPRCRLPAAPASCRLLLPFPSPSPPSSSSSLAAFFPRIQTSGARKNPAGPALRRQNVPTSCGPTRSARRRTPPPLASPAESFSSPPPFPGLRLPSAPLAASFQYGTARQSACARRCLSPPPPPLRPPLPSPRGFSGALGLSRTRRLSPVAARLPPRSPAPAQPLTEAARRRGAPTSQRVLPGGERSSARPREERGPRAQRCPRHPAALAALRTKPPGTGRQLEGGLAVRDGGPGIPVAPLC